MSITRFTRDNVEYYHNLLNQEIAEVAKKYGLTLQGGNGRFGDQELTISVTFKVVREGQRYTDEEIRDADMHYSSILNGAPIHVLGSKWRGDGKVFILDKIATKGKYIFWMRDIGTGDIIRYSPAGLRNQLTLVV